MLRLSLISCALAVLTGSCCIRDARGPSPCHAPAENLERAAEKDLLELYTELLRDACHHSDQFWQDLPEARAEGIWGSGRSDQMNEGVRAMSEMVFVCAVLLKDSDAFNTRERAEYLRRTKAALRYITASHQTGTHPCTDGKRWGGSWQSAMWTGTMGFGAWILREELDPELQNDVDRVVAAEADRFLSVKPPGAAPGDTKAEENGWNLICLSLAANMLRSHSHTAAWRQKAAEYMMNTLSAPQDRHDSRLVDGRAVSNWVSGVNLHPDFTLENHGFFHPAYVACSSYFLTQAAMHYRRAGQPVPEAATHHLLDTWTMFQHLLLPSGESAYPQGMDWELHGLPFINLYASLATLQKNALAARLERAALSCMRAWQVPAGGDLTVPGSRLGFTRHAICAEQAAYGLLAHKVFGPAVKPISNSRMEQITRGVQTHASSGFITHRTRSKLVSFSWTNRLMGMIIPIRPDPEDRSQFTVPLLDGFIGSFMLANKSSGKPAVLQKSWNTASDGFETTGTVLLNGGQLKQQLRVTSIGEKAVVYQDRVTALEPVTITHERGMPLGVENDSITGGRRTVYFAAEEQVFDWKAPRPPSAVSGSWVNIDGRLGAVMLAGSGMRYVQAASYDPQLAVYPDTLCLSCSDQPRQFPAGAQVAHRIALVAVELNATQTRALANSCRIATNNGQTVLHFQVPGETQRNVPLL
jgi:hypothetical protein